MIIFLCLGFVAFVMMLMANPAKAGAFVLVSCLLLGILIGGFFLLEAVHASFVLNIKGVYGDQAFWSFATVFGCLATLYELLKAR